GSGSGVTWNCAADTNISNGRVDCRHKWDGARLNTPTAPAVRHFNGLVGKVSWDVTLDVRSGVSAWVIASQSDEADRGHVSYYSREGSREALNAQVGPTLLLVPVGSARGAVSGGSP